MAPSAIAEPSVIAKVSKKGQANDVESPLEAAKARFVVHNPVSLQLHKEAVRSLPGGNTRTLLHTAPFPVFMKHGKAHQVFDEAGHV